jgi:hypothetical protein
MKVKTLVPLLLGIALAFTLPLSAQRDRNRDSDEQDQQNTNTPLKLIGVIGIPGNPIASTDIVSVDQATERLFFTDRNNGPSTPTPANGAKAHGAVDVIDAENDLYLGRITTGTVGGTAVYFAGATTNRNLGGPNGVVGTPDKKVWAGDGDSTVKVADVDPSSPTYLQIIASISTANLTSVSMCGPTCARDDEIGYDPVHHIIMIANDAPTSIPPYVTFINANFPYNVLGQLNFAAQGLATGNGLEQPLWVPALNRFLITLPITNADGTGSIAVVNPVSRTVDRTINVDEFGCSPTGEDLGPSGHLVVSCGTFPLVIDLRGSEIGPGINQVGGGDEVTYNPGDRRFYVSSSVAGNTAFPVVLGVIDAEDGRWLQNVPKADITNPSAISGGLQPGSIRMGNLAAFGENNHVFVIVHPPAVPAATVPPTPVPPDPTVCGSFGWQYTGCVAVFTQTGEDPDASK